MLKNIAPRIESIIQDEAGLYQECYADLRMYAAFGFTVFGYLCFTYHILVEQKGGIPSFGEDLATDRIYIVSQVLACSEEACRDMQDAVENYKKNLTKQKAAI